jgi:hypothetical protein
MFEKALLVVGLLLIGYMLYPIVTAIIDKYYYKKDSFRNINPDNAPISQQLPLERQRTVSSAGPNPPNESSSSVEKATISPEERPNDPYDEVNTELPIKSNMRHPERSFGPGVDNSGTARSVSAGTASEEVNSSLSSFSPEFAQNGGSFMEGISANDMNGSEYATL